MEALYHQTNALLTQTQGYYVRLEQGGAGDDVERLETEVSLLYTLNVSVVLGLQESKASLIPSPTPPSPSLRAPNPTSPGAGAAGDPVE